MAAFLIGPLISSLKDVLADIHVIFHFFEREGRPGFTLIEPGGGTGGVKLAAFDLLARQIARDPQDLLCRGSAIAVTHGFHAVEQTCLGAEAHDEIFFLIAKRDEQQGGVLIQLPDQVIVRLTRGRLVVELVTGALRVRDAEPALQRQQRILPAAFEMETDGEAQLIEIVPGEKFAMVAVADFEEAAPPPLAEVRDIVVQQWALSEGSKRAKAIAEQVQRGVLSGKSLAEAMKAVGVALPAVETVSGSRMDLNREGQQMPPPLAMMFAMKKGTAKTLDAGRNQGWFVVHLNEVIKGDASKDPQLVAARQQEMLSLLQQEYAAQLISAARTEVGVSKNEGAIKDIRRRLTNQDAAQ